MVRQDSLFDDGPKRAGRKKTTKAPKRFSPSLAGQCLRYTVMDLLGFGRALSAEALQAMHEGSARHRSFQEGLRNEHPEVAVEVTVRDEDLGVSGRMDAVIPEAQGFAVIEYKTVGPDKFDAILAGGPLTAHWAQLLLYLDLTGYSTGYLVVECRSSARRITFQATPDDQWRDWIRQRVEVARAHQLSRKLPSREVSQSCQTCDRWQRCFGSDAERDQAIAEHPVWTPSPPLPQIACTLPKEA